MVSCAIKLRQLFRSFFLYISCCIVALSSMGCSPASILLTYKPALAKSSFEYLAIRSEKQITKFPNNPEKLLAGCKSITQFSFGFTMEEADRLIMKDYIGGKAIYASAHESFKKAVRHGDHALGIKYSGYLEWLRGDSIKKPPFSLQDVPYLYWTAGAYGGAVKSSRGEPEWIILLPRIGKLLESAIDLNPEWKKGALYSAMISYTVIRHDAPPNKNEIASLYFDKAVGLSNGNDLGPYVAMAESVSIPTQNRDQFTKLLKKALDIDIDNDPELRLTNQISQLRAKWLLDNINEFFY